MIPSVDVSRRPVGRVAGWLACVYPSLPTADAVPVVELDSRQYRGRIDVTPAYRLDPGQLTLRIQNLAPGHRNALPAPLADQPVRFVLVLYLYWADALASDTVALVELGGAHRLRALAPHRVGTFAVTDVVRQVAGPVMDTVFHARDAAFDALARSRMGHQEPLRTVPDVLSWVEFASGLPVQLALGEPQPAPGPATPSFPYERDQTALVVLQDLGTMLEQRSGRSGRGAVAIRPDASLVAGTYRTLMDPVHGLDATTGLVEVQRARDMESALWRDPGTRATRATYRLVLLGRGDIHPGDGVRFPGPPDDGASAARRWGVLGGLVAQLGDWNPGLDGTDERVGVVESVRHRLDRREGFVTELAVVQVREPLDAEGAVWDVVDNDATSATTTTAAASPTSRARQGVDARVREVVDRRVYLEAADVRRVHPAVEGDGARSPQSTTTWRGLGRLDGTPHASVLPARRDGPGADTESVPYVTPFAWHGFGLVLPRYPGMRVAVAQPGARPTDPVDLGALWLQGQAREGKHGDWWLSLPAWTDGDALLDSPDDLPEVARGVAHDEEPSEVPTKASHDLTDATGRRVIQVGEFRLAVGPGALIRPEQRPRTAREADGDLDHGLVIEHSSGSAIVFRADGSVEIRAEKGLTVTAKDDLSIATDGNLSLSAKGDVAIDARNVDVTVDQKMNVK